LTLVAVDPLFREPIPSPCVSTRRSSGPIATGEPAIIPSLLEGPPPPKPWPEFAHLHFNDKLVYLVRLEEKSGTPNN
jgi:hypothetical protein